MLLTQVDAKTRISTTHNRFEKVVIQLDRSISSVSSIQTEVFEEQWWLIGGCLIFIAFLCVNEWETDRDIQTDIYRWSARETGRCRVWETNMSGTQTDRKKQTARQRHGWMKAKLYRLILSARSSWLSVHNINMLWGSFWKKILLIWVLWLYTASSVTRSCRALTDTYTHTHRQTQTDVHKNKSRHT